MIEYGYRGFKLIYEIISISKNLYKANGQVLKEEGEPSVMQFQTEYPTRLGVEQEIKKLLENYVNFEWQEFESMN